MENVFAGCSVIERKDDSVHYVLSDIHGDRDAFDTVLTLIDLQPDDYLYILGDVIDRGQRGIDLLQRIRTIENCTLLLGNHEHMMINALRHPEVTRFMRIWQNNDCDYTHIRNFRSFPVVIRKTFCNTWNRCLCRWN